MATQQYLKQKLIPASKISGLPTSSIFANIKFMQIAYNITITAKMKKQADKVILHQQEGVIPPHSFTAILGPSGSGKTTFLNFLAGRLLSDNLVLQGQYKINGVLIDNFDDYSNQIGYVMQEDSLLGMLTPYQCFKFAGDLRLKMSKQDKQYRVNQLINELGLKDCRDVRIGNTFIKGVSGGQKKRTSIGIQLMTNPNILFLDEPTTGLDSTTALQVIQLLGSIARRGKTIVSTIHQPSSEVFCAFNRLMLLCQGRCIYSGSAQGSYEYFAKAGYKCPELMNASQFYLDLMSLQVEEDDNDQTYQSKKENFQIKIKTLEDNFKKSPLAIIQPTRLMPAQIERQQRVSIFKQFWIILYRSFICQIRNPMDLALKIIQSIFTAIVVFIVFFRIDNNNYQNLRGIAFFLVSNNAFGGIQGTLATFSVQRPIFIRERYSKTYTTVAYFLGRTLSNFPFDLIYPTIGVVIVYWATGLGNQEIGQFLRVICVVNTAYFLSSSYGLIYSSIIPKLQTAMALVPVMIIPFMLLGGFFVNIEGATDIRVIFFPLMYLSPFKYGFQAMMLSGINPQPITEKYTPNTYAANIWILTGLGIAMRVIALIAMQYISSSKRPKLKPLNCG